MAQGYPVLIWKCDIIPIKSPKGYLLRLGKNDSTTLLKKQAGQGKLKG